MRDERQDGSDLRNSGPVGGAASGVCHYDANDLLCRWAEKKYALLSVVDVRFEFEDDGDYSEETPGDGPYMSVTITYLGRRGESPQRHTRREVTYDTALIREILAFAVAPTSREGGAAAGVGHYDGTALASAGERVSGDA